MSISFFTIVLLVIEYFVPLIILAYCYARIVWILTRRMDNVDLGTDKGLQAHMFQVARRNTVKTFLIISICFVLCWSCSQFNYLLYNLGYDVDFNETFFKVALLMAFCNCTINPFIYLVKYRDYQTALRELFSYKQRDSDKQEVKHSDVFPSVTTISSGAN